MMLFSTYRKSSNEQRVRWTSESQQAHHLGEIFNSLLLPENIYRPSEFTHCRDLLRDILSLHNASLFPRHGAETTTVVEILNYFAQDRILLFESVCANQCHPTSHEKRFPEVLSLSIWGLQGTDLRAINNKPIQEWIDVFVEQKQRRIFPSPNACPQCHSNCSVHIHLKDTVTWLYFEITPQVLNEALFTSDLHLLGSHGPVTYDLNGIVYSGGNHFSARWRTSDGIWWEYDGRENGGCPLRVTGNTFSEFAGRKAHILFYFLREAPVA